MDCPEKTVLQQYMNGNLSETDAARISKHLKICNTCKDDYETLQELGSDLKEFEPELPDEPYFRELNSAIAQRIEEHAQKDVAVIHTNRFRSIISGTFWLATVAAAMFIVITTVAFYASLIAIEKGDIDLKKASVENNNTQQIDRNENAT
ncbi:anti-sigma factor family protein [bacterium]